MADITPPMLDASALTLGHLAVIHELTGYRMVEAIAMVESGEAVEEASFLAALFLITNPDLSLEDVRRFTIADVEGVNYAGS